MGHLHLTLQRDRHEQLLVVRATQCSELRLLGVSQLDLGFANGARRSAPSLYLKTHLLVGGERPARRHKRKTRLFACEFDDRNQLSAPLAETLVYRARLDRVTLQVIRFDSNCCFQISSLSQYEISKASLILNRALSFSLASQASRMVYTIAL